MEIILAKSAGFCSGVRRAVEMTLAASAAKEGKISTFGPLVHNPQVIELLQLREVQCAEDIEKIDEGLAIIRTHGIPPNERARLREKQLRILDATCPKVIRVQKLVERNAGEGCHVVIVGESEHPEVKGLRGYGGDNCTVISSVEQAQALPEFEKVCLLAQTTQNMEAFEEIRELLATKYPGMQVKNTICSATAKRQEEIRRIAPEVDAMVVIGGRNSGNTRRLVDIAQNECDKPTFWVETEEELFEKDFAPYERIGVTAGASTPSWIIDRVMSKLEAMGAMRKNPVMSRVRKLVDVAVITNLYTSFAAGSLCYTASALLGVKFRPSFFALVFFYVFAMHVLNRFTETGANKFRDDPLRLQFYNRYSKLMLFSGMASMALAIAFSVRMGVIIFLVILISSTFGVLYSVKVVPKQFFNLLGFRRLKDIAASKNFFVASAWAIVSVFPLFLFDEHQNYTKTAVAFLFLFAVTAVRSIYMDVSDIGADRLVGRDSVPIVFGERKTMELLRAIIIFLFVLMFVFSFIKVVPSLGYLLAFWMLFEYLIFELFPKIRIKPKSLIKRDVFVDGHFIAAGALALVWNVL